MIKIVGQVWSEKGPTSHTENNTNSHWRPNIQLVDYYLMDTNITLITEDHLVAIFTIKLHTQHSRISFHNDALIKIGILYYWWKLTTMCYLRPSRNIDQRKQQSGQMDQGGDTYQELSLIHI